MPDRRQRDRRGERRRRVLSCPAASILIRPRQCRTRVTSRRRGRGEGAERIGHGLGRFPAVARLLLQGLEQGAFHALRCVRSKGAERDGGMLEDDLVGAGLPRVESEVGVLVRQKVKQRRGGAIDVGGLADITELADVIGRDEADRSADVALASEVSSGLRCRQNSWPVRNRSTSRAAGERAPSPAGSRA